MKVNNLLVKNTLASILVQLFNIIMNFIIPPFIINSYGSIVNGLISSIKQLISYATLVGGGISIATTHSLFKFIANNDKEGISNVIASSNTLFKKAGFYFLSLAWALAIFYPFFIKSNFSNIEVSTLIFVMSFSGASEFFVIGKYSSLLYADQKSYVLSIVQLIGLVLSFTITLILIELEFSIIVVQFFSSFFYIIRIVLIKLYISKHYSYLNLNKINNDMFIPKNDAFIHQLTGLITMNSQYLIISIFLNLEFASIYSVYNTVFLGIQTLLTQLSYSFAPFLGREIASNKHEELINKFSIFEYSYIIVIGIIYSVSAIMIHPFIKVYLGSNTDINYQDQYLAMLFIVNSFFYTMKLPAQSLISISGHFKQTKNAAIFEAFLSLSMQLILVNFIGIYGILIGSAISIIWRSFDIVKYSNRKILQRNLFVYKEYSLKLTALFMIMYLLYKFTSGFIITTFIDWLVIAIIFTLLAFFISMFLYYTFLKKLMRGNYGENASSV